MLLSPTKVNKHNTQLTYLTYTKCGIMYVKLVETFIDCTKYLLYKFKRRKINYFHRVLYSFARGSY